MTWGLLATIVATFLLQLLVRSSDPVQEVVLFVIGTDWPFRPWTLVTSTFAHAGLRHLLFNGLFLFFLGPSVERLIGGRRMLGLFLVAGAVAGVAQVHLAAALEGSDIAFALGASGALNALFGVLMALVPRQKLLVYGIIPVQIWILGIAYAALDVLGAFDPASGIGNFAHLAGLAIGLAFGAMVRQRAKRRGLRTTQG